MTGLKQPEKIDLFVSGEEDIAQYRIPSSVLTGNRTLLAICDARIDRPGDLPNKINQVIKRSADFGRTWESMRTIVEFPGMKGAGDPSLTVDRETGTVWLFFGYCPGLDDTKSGSSLNRRIMRLQAIRSDDDGITWSNPIDIDSEIRIPEWQGIWPTPGRGVQLTGGRLVVPCTVYKAGTFYSNLVYSDDQGLTWNCSPSAGKDVCEPTLVELENGSMILNARSGRGAGRRAILTSRDNTFRKWSPIIDHSTLIEPMCQGSFIRYTLKRDGYAKNRLLFSNPASGIPWQRRNMTVRLSYDEGKKWPVSKIIHSGPAAYSCLTVLPDGSIALLYERGDKSPYEKITFTRFSLEWLTDGKDSL